MTDNDRPDERRPDLDAELRRLFADERLTLPVAEDIENAVVVGARRRRRHRTTVAAAGGVLAVAALVFVGAALTGIGGHLTHTVTAAAPPSLSATLTTAPATTTPTVRNDAYLLGPYGADGLKLGMPAGAALKMGYSPVSIMGSPYAQGKCIGYTVYPTLPADQDGPTTTPPVTTDALPTKEAPSAARSVIEQKLAKERLVTVLVSARGSIVQLGGVTGLHTPEGIGLGTSAKRVYAVYAEQLKAAGAPASGRSVAVPVPGNDTATYVFYLGADGTVTSLWLRSDSDVTCQ
ncbi:MAG TPA: hypothetical protein VFX16_07100 [Pseudonocardiaceae bacterium]|nr:hypothetical protein [Pseudonocardiaceae bacterium]